MNRSDLKEIAFSIVGEDVMTGLQKWYKDALETKWEYVVFIVRRSYILALLMEKITGKKMAANETNHYLTDASMILHCDELAAIYRKKHRFPTTLLCDDVCIHGRNINHFIKTIEKRLVSLLSEYNEADVKEALFEALRIHVYVRADEPLLLDGKYEFNLSYEGIVNAKFLHKFSNDISLLICWSGIANASYIYSERISEENTETLDLTSFINTSYQNVSQCTKIEFIGEDKEKKAVFTLRIIKNLDGKCSVLPFVFVPNLGTEETQMLLLIIQDRMRDRNIPEEYITRLHDLERIPGKRTFNEIVTLLFSHALLQDFNRKYNIVIQENLVEEELTKLARNYDRYGFEDAKEWLKRILSEQLFVPGEIEEILEHVIILGRKMINIVPGRMEKLSRKNEIMIRRKVERYFYVRGSEEEREAHVISRKPYAYERERTARKARGCGFLFWELNDGYRELEAKYCIAYFLQMMDAGVVCLSSYAPNEINVVGLAQFAKTGEQSLVSEPLRFYEWIPMLAKIEDDCGENPEEFYEELEKYGLRAQSGLDERKLREIENFVKRIYYMGQRIQDWNSWSMSYLYKLEYNLPDMQDASHYKKMSKFLDLQIKHLSDYMEYKRYD